MKENYSRKLPAARSKEKGFVKLTTKQWSVYYWLVSKAYWSAQKREDHYFIYRNSFSYNDIKRDTGINDNRTVKAAFEKLELYNKINITDEVIYIPHPDLYTYLSIDLINYFISISTILGMSIEILVLYSILKRLKELDAKKGQTTTFSLKLLVVLLGHNANDKDSYRLCRVFISFLEGEGLIQTNKTKKINQGGEYIEYTLKEIKESLPGQAFIDLEGEKMVEIENKIKEIWGQD